MKRFKGSKLLVPVSLLAAVAIGVTCATVLHTMTLKNPIKTPTVRVEVNENEAKEVYFTNDGEADVFLRASYSETWLYTEDGGATYTVLPNDESIAKPIVNPDENWTYRDGWYYYNYALKGSANATSDSDIGKTSLLIDGVTFDRSNVTDDRYWADGSEDEKVYSDYQIHVVTEVVQASDDWSVSNDAVQALFLKDLDEPTGWATDKYSAELDWEHATAVSSGD